MAPIRFARYYYCLSLSLATAACGASDGNAPASPSTSGGGTDGAAAGASGSGAPASGGTSTFGGNSTGSESGGMTNGGVLSVGGATIVAGSSAASGNASGATSNTGGKSGGSAAGSAANGTGTSNAGGNGTLGGASTGGKSIGGSSAGGAAAGSTAGIATGGSTTGGAATGGAATAPSAVPTGFASTASNGLMTTTGGGSVVATTVTTCAALKSFLEDSAVRVIEIPSGTTLDCRTAKTTIQACELKCSSTSSKVFWRVPVTGQTCTTLADFNGDGTLDVPAGTLVKKTRTDFRINVKSNKTLRGGGSGATLLGVSLDISNQSNIIVRNLTFTQVNPDLIEAGDGITINTSHHVWIDHCALSMISDGYMDIRYNSSAITVSYTHLDGANGYVCDGQHNFISLVSDSNVTFDHNYFDRVGGRNPKVTGASQVHLYSNFYDGVSYFCANAGTGAALLVEGNYYLNSRYPHWAEGGSIEAIGNQYAGTTSSAGRDDNSSVFTPPYSYALDTVANLPTTIPASAGPKKP